MRKRSLIMMKRSLFRKVGILGSLSEILQQSRALLPILQALDPPKSGLFLVLSLLSREFDAESSSHQTGSSAIESQL